MTTLDDKTPPALSTPRQASFLARFFRALFRTILLLGLIILLLSGAWFGLRELNRSFASVNVGNDANTQRIDLLRSEMDTILAEVPAQQAEIAALQTAVAQANQQLSAQEAGLQADLSRQAEMLTALQVQVGALVSDTGRVQSDLTIIQTNLTSLQTNLDNGLQQVDDSLSQVQTDLDETAEQLRVEISVPAGQIEHIQISLSLFRVWELIARARLQLSENNDGLASLDVEQAFNVMTALANEQTGELADPFQQIRQRLALVLIDLPDNPVTAGRDLDSAWEAIDSLLVSLISGPAATPPPPASLTITPPPTTTPTPLPTIPPILTATPTP